MSTARQFDVSVLGDLNPDIILRGVKGKPAPGRERVVDHAAITIGGSSSIFATVLARLGLRVRMVGKVGADWFGRYVLEALGQEGVDTSAVVIDASVKTGVTVSITGSNDRMLITFPGAIASLCGNEVEGLALYAARHLHLGSYYLQVGLQPAVPTLLKRAVEQGMSTSVDPGYDPYERWHALVEVLPWVDLFFANEEEALQIARFLGQGRARGESDIRVAAMTLARRVRRVVAIKRGARGALACSASGELVAVEPYRVAVIDTTGAGDAFDAGFVFQYLNGQPLQQCLEFANACGAIACTYVGGTTAFPGVDAVRDFMRGHERTPSFENENEQARGG